MDRKRLVKLLDRFKKGRIKTSKVLEKLKHLPYEDMDFAKIDTHRAIRRELPEVVYCQGKTRGQIVKIIGSIIKNSGFCMATRADSKDYNAVKMNYKNAVYNKTARIIVASKKPVKINAEKEGILVVTAGTSDIPVAEEAAFTAEIMGNKVERIYDAGVAGIHRLFNQKEKIFNAKVIIVVAGMEGALASVVGGLVDIPVIAIPTSIGYGASFKGIAALLAMLNSCASNVAVVNIDNGFGAGYIASLINRRK